MNQTLYFKWIIFCLFLSQDGLTEVISKLEEIKEENRSELVDILDSYFDPEKEAIVPPAKASPRRRSFKKGSPRDRRSHNGANKKHPTETNNNDVLATPDSSVRSPRRQRRSRRRFTTKLGKTSPEITTEISTTVTQPAPAIAVA